MKAILVGENRSLHWSDVPNPIVGAEDVLVKIEAAALNRADLMQREGDYPPPPGCPEWMGLEIAGTIVEVGPEAAKKSSWKIGDKVCALLGGGGYAEYANVKYDMLMPIPENCSMVEAAAIPEAFATAYLNLFIEGKIQPGNTLLMNAGASGLASVIIPMAKAFGVRVITTVLTKEIAESIKHLNADVVVHTDASAYLSSFAEEGYLAPQTDFDYLVNYDSNALAASSLDGVNYGFLANYNYFGFLYNKDIFAKVGVEVPTTPDEMIDVVNKLKKAGYGGVMVAGKTWGEAYGRAILMNAIGADGYYKLRTGIDNGSITNIEEFEGVKEALDTMQKYSENDIYYTAFEGTDATAGMSLFAQQKTAIVYGGTYLFGEQEYNFPGINAGYFPVPTYANTGISYAEGGETFVINSSSDKLGAAKLFVEFMATAENLEEFNKTTMKLSTIAGTTWKFDEIQTYVKDYALKQNENFDNVDYWSTGFSNILKSTVYEGKAWKDLNKVYKSQLEEYDLASK